MFINTENNIISMVELDIIPKFRKVGNQGIEHIGNIGFNHHLGKAYLEIWLNSHGFITYMVNGYISHEFSQIQNKYKAFRDQKEIDILTSLFKLNVGLVGSEWNRRD